MKNPPSQLTRLRCSTGKLLRDGTPQPLQYTAPITFSQTQHSSPTHPHSSPAYAAPLGTPPGPYPLAASSDCHPQGKLLQLTASF
eukprot:1158170-Pelagomonas_calceolata.AAC.5